MKIIVLGSEGQIGKPLCEFLKQNGHEVIHIDLVLGRVFDLRHNNAMFDYFFKDCDFVFFLAFDVGGSQYLKKYEHTNEFLDNNLKIMKTVFNLLKKHDKPFIFTSSQMSTMAHSPYGVLKRLGEFYTNNLNGIVVKFWNVYGVETDPEKTHVITDFINSARIQKQINVKTSGLEERQFLHVDDCSRALYTLMLNFSKLRKIDYCITNFQWNSIRDIANIVVKFFPDTQITYTSDVDTVQKTVKNEPTVEILDLWKPQISLEDGIKDVIQKMENQIENNNK